MLYENANLLYRGGDDAIRSASWKYHSQLFEKNQLLEVAKLQEEIRNLTYQADIGNNFVINERGKRRVVTSISCRDKAVNHMLCDNVLSPILDKYLIYDNSSSREGKGTAFHRMRLEQHLHEYYRKCKTNKGYILLGDFQNYYGSIDTKRAREKMIYLLKKSGELSDEDIKATEWLLETIFGNKIGINIGSQPSQNIGITYAYRIDNYVKTVRGQKWYARYSDDFRIISNSKEELLDILEGIKKIADEEKLVIHPRKTHIARIDKPFTHLQISYFLTDTGKLVKRIKPKAIKRERDRLKAYKSLLDAGRMSEIDIENAYKCWLMCNYKVMSSIQIQRINGLYKELFGREIRWKNGKLRYLTKAR